LELLHVEVAVAVDVAAVETFFDLRKGESFRLALPLTNQSTAIEKRPDELAVVDGATAVGVEVPVTTKQSQSVTVTIAGG
jgi:hypothetical protein